MFSELQGAGLVRELHVYGQMIPTKNKALAGEDKSQHVGLGSQLMRQAEIMSARAGYGKVAVISGVGVRNFYRKLGYELDPTGGEFMIKRMSLSFRIYHHRFSPLVIWAVVPLLLGVVAFYVRSMLWS